MAYLFNEELRLALAPVLESLGFEWVGCELQSVGGKNQILKVFIDKEKGITINDCARASHQIKGILEVEKSISGNYFLEVSSPGLDRPLYTLAHYQRFVGSRAKVRMHKSIEGRRQFTGTITEANDKYVVLLVDGQHFMLPLYEIDKANLVFER